MFCPSFDRFGNNAIEINRSYICYAFDSLELFEKVAQAWLVLTVSIDANADSTSHPWRDNSRLYKAFVRMLSRPPPPTKREI